MINRNAIIVKPKEPFKIWIKNTGGDFQITSDLLNIYLVPEVDDLEEIDEVMIDFWKPVFEEELNEWWYRRKFLA